MQPAKVPWIPRNPHKPKWDDFTFPTLRNFKPGQAHNPTFEGWDSETIQHEDQCGKNLEGFNSACDCDYGKQGLRGKAFLFCTSREAYICRPDNPHIITELLEFMLEGGNRRMNAFWNIDYDIRTLFKWDSSFLLELYPEKNGMAEITYQDRFEIVYLRKKYFYVKDILTKRSANFYDAMLFYQQSLASASSRYLRREAHELKQSRSKDMFAMFNRNPSAVIGYCKQDAQDAKDLLALFITKLHRLDFFPRKPISSGYLAQDYLRSKSDMPTVYNVSGSINRPAWEAFKGGWVDIWQRGAMHVWKADINSAYPHAMRDLPDVRDGEWRNEYIKEAPIGFVRCVITQSTNGIPILASWMRNVHGYPTIDAPVQAWITIQEYQAMQTLEGYHTTLLEAVSFIPKRYPRTPFLVPVDNMVKYKNSFHPKRGVTPDEAAYLAAKQLFNSFYGKSCERINQGDSWRAGKLFMPVYAATITAKCRVLMLDAIKPHPESVAAIATDCVMATRPIRVPTHDTELGLWKIECEGEPATIVFPGIYEIGDDTTHSRGFRITTCVCGHESRQHAGKQCTYCACETGFKASLRRLIERSEGNALEIRYERPWGVREAFRQSDMDMVGVFETKIYDKGIDTLRRLWLDPQPLTFRDLLHNQYKSVPLPVSMLDANLLQYDMEDEALVS